MNDSEFLLAHALEPPLSYSRPYCLIEHAPIRVGC
jgi:cobalt/nickel transport system ATP-binding protein